MRYYLGSDATASTYFLVDSITGDVLLRRSVYNITLGTQNINSFSVSLKQNMNSFSVNLKQNMISSSVNLRQVFTFTFSCIPLNTNCDENTSFQTLSYKMQKVPTIGAWWRNCKLNTGVCFHFPIENFSSSILY